MQSIRQVTEDTAQSLKKALDKRIKAVGVFVNEDMDFILSLCNQNIIDMIQIHGDEDEAYLRMLKSKTDKPVIRAFRIRSNDDIIRAEGSSADYVLLDSYKEGTYGEADIGFLGIWQMNYKENIFLQEDFMQEIL